MKIIAKRKIMVKPFKTKKINRLLGKEIVYEYGIVRTIVPREYIGKKVEVLIFGD